ncbi:MAG: alpha/beta hydrolase family esterase [Acidimicrobiia bacterium]
MRAPLLLAIILAAVSVVGCSTSGEDIVDEPPTTTEAPCTQTMEPGVSNQSGTYDGEERTWQIAVPEGAPKGLIFDFHGTGGSPQVHDSITRMSAEGTARGYVVITPQGLENPARWTVPGIPGPDDVAFVEALAEETILAACVEGPVIATGKSSGAAMTSQLACTSPTFSVFAPVAGINLYRRCATGAPISVITFHGTADQWVPYIGPDGWKEVEQETDTFFIGDVEATVAAFAERAECDQPTQSELGGDTLITDFRCTVAEQVALYRIEGGGHTHPGTYAKERYEELGATDTVGSTTETFDGTVVMLDFFDQVIDNRRSQ